MRFIMSFLIKTLVSLSVFEKHKARLSFRSVKSGTKCRLYIKASVLYRGFKNKVPVKHFGSLFLVIFADRASQYSLSN